MLDLVTVILAAGKGTRMKSKLPKGQYFDWLYWPDHLEKLSWSREEQIRDLHARFMRNAERLRAEMDGYLVEKYGPEQAAGIPFVQCFEISEYGEAPSEEFLSLIEKPE